MKTTEMLGTIEEDKSLSAKNAPAKNAFPMETHEILDRFELLYPRLNELADLRRAYVDKDLSSIFRLLPLEVNGDINDLRKAVMEQNLHSIFRLSDDENLRKLILEDNEWKLWPVLNEQIRTQFVAALKNFYVNDTYFDKDCLSRGQINSKLWLVNQLAKLNLNLGTVFICAGWYATLATMLFEKGFRVDKIRSFDIDPDVVEIAKTFNKPWVMEDWKFQASTANIHEIDYNKHTYKVTRSDGTTAELTDSPDTIINTSCEHIKDFDKWYAKIPEGKLVILQSNDYTGLKEHVNCVKNVTELSDMAPMSDKLYAGSLKLDKYKRYMVIGYK